MDPNSPAAVSVRSYPAPIYPPGFPEGPQYGNRNHCYLGATLGKLTFKRPA